MKIFVWIMFWLVTVGGAYLVGSYVPFNRKTVVPTKYGRFLSTPKVEALDDGRKLKMLEDFIYIDPDETAWLAATGREVDGASIPQVFWTVMGGPFSGKYRNASIVHDVECVDKKRPAKDVHLMFFHACLAGGVPEQKAKLMYWAVAKHGPQWASEIKLETKEFTKPNGDLERMEIPIRVTRSQAVEKPTEADVTWALEYFEQNNPPVEVIPELDRSELEGP